MVPNIPPHLLNFSYTHPYSLTTSFYHLKLPNSYPLPPKKLCFLSSFPLWFACQLLLMEGNKKPYNKGGHISIYEPTSAQERMSSPLEITTVILLFCNPEIQFNPPFLQRSCLWGICSFFIFLVLWSYAGNKWEDTVWRKINGSSALFIKSSYVTT